MMFVRRRIVEPVILLRVVLAEAAVQVLLALTGHFLAWAADYLVLPGGMVIAAAGGFFYAREFDKGYAAGALGGALAGGVCAAAGAAVSVALGDATVYDLAFRTGVSILAGVLGGPLGQIAANRA